jgi:hypothetical protein
MYFRGSGSERSRDSSVSTAGWQLASVQAVVFGRPRWPHFGLTTALKAAVCCASLSSVSASQQAYEPVVDVPADLYGSEGRRATHGPDATMMNGRSRSIGDSRSSATCTNVSARQAASVITDPPSWLFASLTFAVPIVEQNVKQAPRSRRNSSTTSGSASPGLATPSRCRSSASEVARHRVGRPVCQELLAWLSGSAPSRFDMASWYGCCQRSGHQSTPGDGIGPIPKLTVMVGGFAVHPWFKRPVRRHFRSLGS